MVDNDQAWEFRRSGTIFFGINAENLPSALIKSERLILSGHLVIPQLLYFYVPLAAHFIPRHSPVSMEHLGNDLPLPLKL